MSPAIHLTLYIRHSTYMSPVTPVTLYTCHLSLTIHVTCHPTYMSPITNTTLTHLILLGLNDERLFSKFYCILSKFLRDNCNLTIRRLQLFLCTMCQYRLSFAVVSTSLQTVKRRSDELTGSIASKQQIFTYILWKLIIVNGGWIIKERN